MLVQQQQMFIKECVLWVSVRACAYVYVLLMFFQADKAHVTMCVPSISMLHTHTQCRHVLRPVQTAILASQPWHILHGWKWCVCSVSSNMTHLFFLTSSNWFPCLIASEFFFFLNLKIIHSDNKNQSVVKFS